MIDQLKFLIIYDKKGYIYKTNKMFGNLAKYDKNN